MEPNVFWRVATPQTRTMVIGQVQFITVAVAGPICLIVAATMSFA
jgi:hypothetical protein